MTTAATFLTTKIQGKLPELGGRVTHQPELAPGPGTVAADRPVGHWGCHALHHWKVHDFVHVVVFPTTCNAHPVTLLVCAKWESLENLHSAVDPVKTAGVARPEVLHQQLLALRTQTFWYLDVPRT